MSDMTLFGHYYDMNKKRSSSYEDYRPNEILDKKAISVKINSVKTI
jgi:hypothetical protein